MQVVITIAGKGLRFSEKGFLQPKPSVIVGGRPAISYLIDSFSKKHTISHQKFAIKGNRYSFSI